MTQHKAGERGGTIGYTGNCPGSILPIRLSNEAIQAQHDVFVAAFGDFELTADLSYDPNVLFRGDALLLERLWGDGIVFVHAGGDLFDVTLKKGEEIRVEYGSVVAWDDSVKFDSKVSSFETALRGKGMLFNILTGPGKVIIQTMSLGKAKNCIRTSGCGPLPFMVVNSFFGRVKKFFKIGW